MSQGGGVYERGLPDNLGTALWQQGPSGGCPRGSHMCRYGVACAGLLAFSHAAASLELRCIHPVACTAAFGHGMPVTHA